jgi:hypothetical protein
MSVAMVPDVASITFSTTASSESVGCQATSRTDLTPEKRSSWLMMESETGATR